MKQGGISHRVDNAYNIIQTLRVYKRRKRIESRSYKEAIVFLFIRHWLSSPTLMYGFFPYLMPMLGMSVQSWIYLTMSASFLSFLMHLLILLIPNLKKLSNPIDAYLANIQEAQNDDTELIEILACASLQDLEQVIKILDYETNRMESQLSGLTHIFQRTGIISILVVIYIAYEKKDIVWSQLTFIPFILILSYFVGMVIRTFIKQDLIEKSRLLLLIVKTARDKAVSRNAFQYL